MVYDFGPLYASGHAWATALPQLITDMADSAVLDSVSVAPSLRAALVDQLAVIRPLLGHRRDLATAHASRGCYVLIGVVRGVAVTLAGTLSGARRLDLDLVGAARHWHARMDAVALASPARISVSDAHGEYALPPLYESPLRAAWAARHDACLGDAPLPYPADQLADDLAMAEVPPSAPLEVLAPLGCGLQTGAGSVLNELRPPAGPRSRSPGREPSGWRP
jgi:hypothetical protein